MSQPTMPFRKDFRKERGESEREKEDRDREKERESTKMFL
jgi:hypothetical protein